MGGRLSHSEMQSLLGAYALDAVDDDEREMVAEHLRSCPRCRAEVVEHVETAGFLTHGWAPAPAGVWERIAGSLEERPPPLRLAAVSSPPEQPRRGALWAVSAVAVAASVVAVVLGVKVVDDQRRMARLTASAPSVALERAADATLADPGARRVDLRSADGAKTVRAVLLPDGTGYLLSANLPPLPPGRAYQLWALVGTEKVSAGVLGRGVAPSPFKVSPTLSGLAITEEGSGGVPVTDRQPVVVGQVLTS